MTGICFLPHIFTRRLLTLLALLFRCSFSGLIKKIVIVFLLDFSETARSIIDLAV